MGEQRQGATYFTFKGGLNTESSPLNAPPEDATDLVNIQLTNVGTARKRKGIDFLPQLNTSTLFVSNPADFSTTNGYYTAPAPSGISFRVTKEDGQFFRAFICQVGRDIYIYDQALIPTQKNMGTAWQIIRVPDTWDSRLIHYKTQFVKDSKRVYLLNPYMPLSYLVYSDTDQKFRFSTETVYVRELDKNTDIDDRVSVNKSTYRCILGHIASAHNKPETGDGWREVWVQEGQKPVTDAPLDWVTGVGTRIYLDTEAVASDGESEAVFNRTIYGCILSHTSSDANKPPNSTYWVAAEDERVETGTLAQLESGPFSKYEEWESGIRYTSATGFTYFTSIRSLPTFDSTNTPRGFGCGVLAAGRLWLAGSAGEPNTLYFSQSITDDRSYSRFYQWADPNNPDDPDVAETDGGKIKITGAEEIVGVADYRGGVLVLATNGIWYLTGSDGYFKATTYSIQKLSDEGCVGRSAWTYVEDLVVYAGASGVYVVQLDSVSLAPTIASISDKIKTFWSNIPRFQRESCELAYNQDTFQIIVGLNFTTPDWWFKVNHFKQATMFRDFLVFDTRLKAWYKYQMNTDTVGTKLTPSALIPFAANLTGTEEVTVEDVTVTADTFAVEVPTTDEPRQTVVGVICIQKQSDNTVKWSLCIFEGSETSDYSRNSTYTEEYAGWLESVPQLFSDIGHRKQIAYLTTAFERVEDGFNLTTREYTNPGGCFYRILWDFADSPAAGVKYGAAYQAYKPNRYNLVHEDGVLTGHEVVRNKHRIRGTGRALALRFETDNSKDFHLLGWQLDIYASEKV